MKRNKENELGTWQPNLRKTPRGGKIMAKRISMQVAVPSSAIFYVCMYVAFSFLVLKIEEAKRGF